MDFNDLLKKLDSYTGAPARAFVSEAQKTDDITTPFKKFAKQWGEDPATAPTGQDIVKKAGIPDVNYDVPVLDTNPYGQPIVEKVDKMKVNPSEIAGVAADVVIDPLNVAAFGASQIPRFAKVFRNVKLGGYADDVRMLENSIDDVRRMSLDELRDVYGKSATKEKVLTRQRAELQSILEEAKNQPSPKNKMNINEFAPAHAGDIDEVTKARMIKEGEQAARQAQDQSLARIVELKKTQPERYRKIFGEEPTLVINK